MSTTKRTASVMQKGPTKITKPKLGRPLGKKNNPKVSIEDITVQKLDNEMAVRYENLTNNIEIKFIQSNGFSQQVLKDFYTIQSENLESSFTPETLDHNSLVKAVEENYNDLYSTDYYNLLEDIQLKPMDNLDQFFNNFNFKNEVQFQFNTAKSQLLKPVHAIHYPYCEQNLRNGVVFNTGGLSLTMEWCPLILNNKRYLFVSNVDQNANISEFSDSKSILSIYEVGDVEDEDVIGFCINKQIMIDYVIKEIEFSPISSDTTLLKLTLSNGEIEIWKIDSNFLFENTNKDELKIYTAESGNLKLAIPNKTMLITTSTFISTNHILFGTNHGFVGQFSINTGKLDYLISLRLPSINNICTLLSTDSNDNAITVLVSAMDFNEHLLSVPLPNRKSCLLNNLKIIEIPTSSRELSYKRNVVCFNNFKMFANIEHLSTLRMIGIEDPHNMKKMKIYGNNEIVCLSNQLNYKDGILHNGNIMLTGHSNGTVRLMNYLNILTITDKRPQPSTLRILQMNKLSNDINENRYWLDLNYEVNKLGEENNVNIKSEPSKVQQVSIGRTKGLRKINPPGIIPMKISMMNDNIATIWGNGLIIVEKMSM